MEALLQYWPIFVTAIGTVVWLVRLEGKITFLEKVSDMQQAEIEAFSDLRDLVIEIKNDISWLKRTMEKKYNVKK